MSIENIWAIKIHQAEVGWEGDHKPQLPEAKHQAEVGWEGDHKPQLPEAKHQAEMRRRSQTSTTWS